MPKKKRQPKPDPAPPKDKPPAPQVKNSLPPDALKQMRKFYEDSREIERKIWRSIHG